MKLSGVPVAAPSANLSGRPSPTNAEQVYADFNGLVSAVVDGGACSVGIESTVLDLTARDPLILRPGTVTREDLENPDFSPVCSSHRRKASISLSPGIKETRHYAPRAGEGASINSSSENLRLLRREQSSLLQHRRKRLVFLLRSLLRGSGENDFVSLGSGDAVEYARLLYKGLHALDGTSVDVILCPELRQ